MPKKKSELIRSKVFYYGTSVNNSFWNKADDADLAETGYGELWLTGKILNFRLYLTTDPVQIQTKAITHISMGHTHTRKFSMAPILKIHWTREGETMVSGFSMPKRIDELRQWQWKLQKVLKAKL
jgi:hypothetical protein